MEKNAVYWSLVEELAMRQGVLFVGAGLSMGAGSPGWGRLLERLNRELGTGFGPPRGDFLDYAERLDLAAGRTALGQGLAGILRDPQIAPTSVHRALLSLPFFAVFTTNYDNLIERALRGLARPYDAIRYDEEVGVIDHHEAMPVIKFHGDLEDPPGIVLTRTDYDLYAMQHPAFLSLFEALLATRTFVFVGFSLSDPNFQALDRTVQRALGRYRRKAYAVMVDDGLRLETPPHFDILWVPLSEIDGALTTLAQDIRALTERPAPGIPEMVPKAHDTLRSAFRHLKKSLFTLSGNPPSRPKRRTTDTETRSALYQLIFDMERFRMEDPDYWMKLGIAFFKIRDYRAALRALGHVPIQRRKAARIVARCHWYLGEKWRTRRILDHQFYPGEDRQTLDHAYLQRLPGDASFFAHTCNWEASEHLERRRFHRTRYLANRGLMVLQALLAADLEFESSYFWHWKYVYNHIGRSHLLLFLSGLETDACIDAAQTNLQRAIEEAGGGFPAAWSNLLDLYKAIGDRDAIDRFKQDILASRKRSLIRKLRAWHPDESWQ